MLTGTTTYRLGSDYGFPFALEDTSAPLPHIEGLRLGQSEEGDRLYHAFYALNLIFGSVTIVRQSNGVSVNDDGSSNYFEIRFGNMIQRDVLKYLYEEQVVSYSEEKGFDGEVSYHRYRIDFPTFHLSTDKLNQDEARESILTTLRIKMRVKESMKNVQ